MFSDNKCMRQEGCAFVNPYSGFLCSNWNGMAAQRDLDCAGESCKGQAFSHSSACFDSTLFLDGVGQSSTIPIRLADCNLQEEGCCRVEVFVSGEWGTVCDDSWDDQDARVVCAEVGCSGGNPTAVQQFGGGVGQIWLDEVSCTGSEASLSDCDHNGWGQHNCGHYEDAGDEGSCLVPCRALSLLPGRMHMTQGLGALPVVSV